MYQKILEFIRPEVGVVVRNGKKEAAISRSYPIDGNYFGLGVVVADNGEIFDTYTGGETVTSIKTCVYLTQHEGGKNTIDAALEKLKTSELGYKVTIKPLVVGKSYNLRRVVVDIYSYCECGDNS